MFAERIRDEVLRIDSTLSTDSERRAAYSRIGLDLEKLPPAPMDPFSADYKEWVLTAFNLITGKPYDVNAEGLTVDIAWEVDNAFPYGTRDPQTIGSFLIAFGWLIRELALSPGASILEIGAGLGSLTGLLARSGYQVTALEINKGNADVIRLSTAHLAMRPRVVLQNVSDYHPNERFDCVIFFESFHHLLNHAELVARCKSWLKPGGKVVFAAEPIVDENPLLPYPWGLRLDGESLRAIASWGWLELGFDRKYFEEMLTRAGFTFQRTSSTLSHWASAYTAFVSSSG
jgi:2-polyprenyl-3-methyl-5-hydroxy-6-metoxy-1,4-benzoquinol methylase